VENLRGALGPGPEGLEPPPLEVPADEPPADDRPPAVDLPAPPLHPDLDDLRRELETRELELVAAGKGWSGLAHRAYGELRLLPAQPPPPPSSRTSTRTIRIDDEDWDAPSWRSFGED
jgi:hypothetical protein